MCILYVYGHILLVISVYDLFMSRFVCIQCCVCCVGDV